MHRFFKKLKAHKIFKTIRNRIYEHADGVSFYLIIYFKSITEKDIRYIKEVKCLYQMNLVKKISVSLSDAFDI